MVNNSRKAGDANVWAIAVLAIVVAALYLTGLTRMGMYGPDEPRYADIGRAMAHSGDWITPRLWGQPWFEKPALLYWMTATGFGLGLGPEFAPRLPVALLSLAFLVFFRQRLARLFDSDVANYATAILATSAGWLAYSHVAVTDLPLTVCFSTALLLSLSGKETPPLRVLAAAALGLAVLAKSVPPLVLFLPVLVMDRRHWRRWFALWPLAVFALVALPWHVVATIRNGWHFPYVLFVEQQFGRFFNHTLLHEQPWWFYAPVFLLLLFPWFPLLVVGARHIRSDERARTLAVVVAFGFVFFSVSVNKLPGYVLPLVTATCALIGYGLARTERRERWLVPPIALLGLLPAVAVVLPDALAHGWRSVHFPANIFVSGLVIAAALGGVLAWLWHSRLFPLAVLLAACSFLWLQITLFPVLDKAASGRYVWLASHPDCAPVLPREQLYGLYYYSGKTLPDCGIVDKNALPYNAGGPKK